MIDKKIIKQYVLITFAAFITAIAVNIFFVHDGLAPGGITGLSLVVSNIISVRVDVVSLMVTIPLLMLATIRLGRTFGVKTLYISLMTPFFMSFLPQYWLFQGLAKINPYLELGLSGIIAGILVGTGIALALNSDCATGGTDVMALLIHQHLDQMKLSNIIFILDGLIIVGSGLIKNDLLVSVFSFISLLVIINTIKILTISTE